MAAGSATLHSAERSSLTCRLATLLPQVNSLGETAERLIQSHPESAEDLQEKCTELDQAWSSLGKRADQRKAKLGDSHDLQRFLSDFRYVARSRWAAIRFGQVTPGEAESSGSPLPEEVSASLSTCAPFPAGWHSVSAFDVSLTYYTCTVVSFANLF